MSNHKTEHMQWALRRVMRYARQIRETNNAVAAGACLHGSLERLGSGVDGLCAALDEYEEIQRIVELPPLEG